MCVVLVRALERQSVCLELLGASVEQIIPWRPAGVKPLPPPEPPPEPLPEQLPEPPPEPLPEQLPEPLPEPLPEQPPEPLLELHHCEL